MHMRKKTEKLAQHEKSRKTPFRELVSRFGRTALSSAVIIAGSYTPSAVAEQEPVLYGDDPSTLLLGDTEGSSIEEVTRADPVLVELRETNINHGFELGYSEERAVNAIDGGLHPIFLENLHGTNPFASFVLVDGRVVLELAGEGVVSSDTEDALLQLGVDNEDSIAKVLDDGGHIFFDVDNGIGSMHYPLRDGLSIITIRLSEDQRDITREQIDTELKHEFEHVFFRSLKYEGLTDSEYLEMREICDEFHAMMLVNFVQLLDSSTMNEAGGMQDLSDYLDDGAMAHLEDVLRDVRSGDTELMSRWFPGRIQHDTSETGNPIPEHCVVPSKFAEYMDATSNGQFNFAELLQNLTENTPLHSTIVHGWNSTHNNLPSTIFHEGKHFTTETSRSRGIGHTTDGGEELIASAANSLMHKPEGVKESLENITSIKQREINTRLLHLIADISSRIDPNGRGKAFRDRLALVLGQDSTSTR